MPAGFCIGTWQMGPSHGFWEGRSKSDLTKAFHYLLRHGAACIDTAQAYGNGASEQFIAAQLKFLSREIPRERLFISTKIMPGPTDPEKLVLKSLRRLHLDWIDAVYLHWPNYYIDQFQYLEKLTRLVDCGIIKTIGLSNYTSQEAIDFVGRFPISLFQRPISLAWSKDLEADRAFCSRYNLTLVGYSPLAMGLLASQRLDYEDSRKDLYCLQEPSRQAFKALLKALGSMGLEQSAAALCWAARKADMLVVGSTSLEQAKANLCSMQASLEPEEMKALDELSRKLSDTTSRQSFLHEPPCAILRTC